MTRDLLAVHAVGVDDAGIALLRERGAAIVWCPSSNHFLFGRTAPAALLAPGIDVLLGSDSHLTADGSLLHELRCAREIGLVDDDRLLDAVGVVAARAHRGRTPRRWRSGRARTSSCSGVHRSRRARRTSRSSSRVACHASPIRRSSLRSACSPATGRLKTLDGVVRWISDQPASWPDPALPTMSDTRRLAR